MKVFEIVFKRVDTYSILATAAHEEAARTALTSFLAQQDDPDYPARLVSIVDRGTEEEFKAEQRALLEGMSDDTTEVISVNDPNTNEETKH